MKKHYVIKQCENYLHCNGKIMKFSTDKNGAQLFLETEAKIVMNTLTASGLTGIFKARVKDKFVSEKPALPVIPGYLNELKKRRAKKRLEKGVVK